MKTYLTTILAALAVASPLSAQTFGVRGGMTLSTLGLPEELSDYYEMRYKPGLHLGLATSLGGDGPGLFLSAAYSQRGATGIFDWSYLEPRYTETSELSIDLAYIDIAAFGRFPIGTGPYLLVGPTLSLRVACSSTVDSETEECRDVVEDPEYDPYKIYDFGFSGGAGMSFDLGGRNLVVEVLYGLGILNIVHEDRIRDDDDWIRNRGFTIRMGLDVGG